jgi:hypothetical protein
MTKALATLLFASFAACTVHGFGLGARDAPTMQGFDERLAADCGGDEASAKCEALGAEVSRQAASCEKQQEGASRSADMPDCGAINHQRGMVGARLESLRKQANAREEERRHREATKTPAVAKDTHPDRAIIDAQLVAKRDSCRVVAQKFAVSQHATARHLAAHIPRALARQAARDEAHRDRSLQDRILTYLAYTERLRDRAERDGDLRTAIAAQRELTRLAELEARARGELRAPASGERPVVHVNIGQPLSEEDRQQALREARLLLEFEADEQRDREALVSGGVQAP